MELFTLKPRTGPAESVALPGLSISATVYNEDAFRDHTQPPSRTSTQYPESKTHTQFVYKKKRETRNSKLESVFKTIEMTLKNFLLKNYANIFVFLQIIAKKKTQQNKQS